MAVGRSPIFYERIGFNIPRERPVVFFEINLHPIEVAEATAASRPFDWGQNGFGRDTVDDMRPITGIARRGQSHHRDNDKCEFHEISKTNAVKALAPSIHALRRGRMAHSVRAGIKAASYSSSWKFSGYCRPTCSCRCLLFGNPAAVAIPCR